MSSQDDRFEDYLSRHYGRLGDVARHRAAKQRQLWVTYHSLLPADREAEMLEIGPGFGQWLEELRTHRGYSRTTAMDLSREVVEHCNALLPGSTEWAGDAIAWLRARPARFERVFLFHVLEHVLPEATSELLSSIHAALRPGGRVVVEVPNMANLLTGGYLRYADPTHETGYTEFSLQHRLESAGFTEVTCFEDRVPVEGARSAAAVLFRGSMRVLQRTILRGYQMPVPRVLTPSLCAVGTRPLGTA